MHLSSRTTLALIALALVACGPEVHDKPDWMLGTFSDRSVRDASIGVTGVAHYEFLDDGTLLKGGVSECEANIESEPATYAWKRTSEETIVVNLPSTGSGVDAWEFHPGAYNADPDVESDWYCNKLRWDEVRNGVGVVGTTYLQRGAVCMKALPPCEEGTSCASCETIWCDDAPPECEN